MNKHIDDLVAAQQQKQAELLLNASRIASSATSIALVFIDLVDSTRIKLDRPPEQWLGYVFQFIQCVDHHAKKKNGTVVKRIGDELMITFASATEAENFIDELINDKSLFSHQFKIAADYGTAYHFRFVEELPDDPYGLIVDRCARILRYAGPGMIVCTKDYWEQTGRSRKYTAIGDFGLRGFKRPEPLLARSFINIDSAEFLKPLLKILDAQAANIGGFRFVSRNFTIDFIRKFGEDQTKPFLARELLNLPKLPYSPKEFGEVVAAANNREEKEQEFYGYLVDWKGIFTEFKRNDSDIDATVRFGDHQDP